MSGLGARQGSRTLKSLLVWAGFTITCLMGLGLADPQSPSNTTEPKEAEPQCQSSFHSTATILPLQLTDLDDIRVVVEGWWENPGYDITHSCRIEDRVITIEVKITQKPGSWPQGRVEWQFTQDIGKLAPGSYIVVVNGGENWGTWASTLFVTAAPVGRSVSLGEPLKFAFPQSTQPLDSGMYDGWALKCYDPAYFELIQEGFEDLPTTEMFPGPMGITSKVFVFRAIKRGQTRVVFADCQLDASGRCIQELVARPYNVSIY